MHVSHVNPNHCKTLTFAPKMFLLTPVNNQGVYTTIAGFLSKKR